MLVLPGMLGPRPPSRGCDWVVWAFQRRAQVERAEMEGIVVHRYPIMWLEEAPLAPDDGPSRGTWGPPCFMFDDKLFFWGIMVNAIMSNDGEPQNHSQSQAVRFLLKNWIQFIGFDCYIHMVIPLKASAPCWLYNSRIWKEVSACNPYLQHSLTKCNLIELSE